MHVFLVLFESQPQMKRIFRSYRGKKHSELRLNEDLQQLVMYLISVLKKIVKYLEESRTIVKYLRRIAKKYSSPSIDLARFDPHDLAALFCNAVRETLPRNDQVITYTFKVGNWILKLIQFQKEFKLWTSEVEASWSSLFGAILGAFRILLTPVKKDASCGPESGSEYGDEAGGHGEEDRSDCSTSSSTIMPPITSFDRHLVLIGCQSFQVI